MRTLVPDFRFTRAEAYPPRRVCPTIPSHSVAFSRLIEFFRRIHSLLWGSHISEFFIQPSLSDESSNPNAKLSWFKALSKSLSINKSPESINSGTGRKKFDFFLDLAFGPSLYFGASVVWDGWTIPKGRVKT